MTAPAPVAVRPADNPFRTERIDRLVYRPAGASWPELERRFAALGRRAAVVGGHGTGKSRFLATFADRLEAGGQPTVRLRCARDPVPGAAALAGRVLIVDELEHLGPLARRRLWARAGRAAGVLAAVHRPHRGLPVLHRCAADPALVTALLDDLGAGPPPADLAALLDRHAGNVRALLRDLYDRALQGPATG